MSAADFDTWFRAAVEAIDRGDLASLERVLREHPDVARRRLRSPGEWLRTQIGGALDSFYKHPYLMWFLTEDAVRTGSLAANIAHLSRAVIGAARRSGTRDLQKQLDSTFHFAVCSSIGRDDGRQLELLDVLIDEGASMAGGPDQALICHNDAAARHLLARGAVLTLPTAVCLEMAGDIRRLAPAAKKRDKQMALALAALNGRAKGLALLLPFGVDIDAFSTGFYSHATPLHHAVWSGSLDAVKVLVEAGARLTTKDRAEKATPLGWAEYAATGTGWRERGKQYDQIAAYLQSKTGG